jgi:hypothetical protein
MDAALMARLGKEAAAVLVPKTTTRSRTTKIRETPTSPAKPTPLDLSIPTQAQSPHRYGRATG